MDFAAGSIQRQKGLGNDMAKAVRVHQVGGPDVDPTRMWMSRRRQRRGAHPPARHRPELHRYLFPHRLYKAPGLPFIVGNGRGRGGGGRPRVTDFHPGDRVAYYYNLGGYATERNIPADKLVKLPDHISYEQGAVLMLKG